MIRGRALHTRGYLRDYSKKLIKTNLTQPAAFCGRIMQLTTCLLGKFTQWFDRNFHISVIFWTNNLNAQLGTFN